MSLRYVIDGYNLINHPHIAPHLRKKNQDCRIALLEFIRAKKLCGSPNNRAILVFDGYPPTPAIRRDYANFELIFAQEESADARIKAMVERSVDPRNIVVVSDDKEIKIFVKSCSAGALGVEEFIHSKEEAHTRLKSNDLFKPELGRAQVEEINRELSQRWLKDEKR